MLWVFVMAGVLALTAAALGFLSTARSRSIHSAVHFIALFLIAAAWIGGHRDSSAWIAMLAAGLIEIVLWARVWVAQEEKRESVKPIHGAAPAHAIEPEPDPPKAAPLRVRSIVLLRAHWNASIDVLVASLRRGGRRDAHKDDTSGNAVRMGGGQLLLECQCLKTPVERELIGFALSQTFDWPGAEEATRAHQAFVALTTVSDPAVPRGVVLSAHCAAQKALLEFGPVVGILWPDAGRLMSVDSLRALPDGATDASAICVCFRAFAIQGSPGAVCDSVGLHVFGLADFQVAVESEPDAKTTELLEHLVRRAFENGKCVVDGDMISVGGAFWRARLQPASYPPERNVLVLSHSENAKPTEASTD